MDRARATPERAGSALVHAAVTALFGLLLTIPLEVAWPQVASWRWSFVGAVFFATAAAAFVARETRLIGRILWGAICVPATLAVIIPLLAVLQRAQREREERSPEAWEGDPTNGIATIILLLMGPFAVAITGLGVWLLHHASKPDE